MRDYRLIQKSFKSVPTVEGAGVRLKRAMGFDQVPLFDPFLLLDDFRSNRPDFYLKGFPWHPHRGIETITYVLQGEVDHGDSLGNRGTIAAGDVQWMTAGSGIVHQEMPKGDEAGILKGFQLWANLPAAYKMMAPRYREIRAPDIPVVTLDGATLRVICGTVQNTLGPVQDIVSEPEYLDVTVPAGSRYVHPTPPGHTVFAYVIEGRGCFCPDRKPGASDMDRDGFSGNETLILFGDGLSVRVDTEEEPVRFLLISGKPLGEPVAWGGPIVMNTREELETAFEEYRRGTFIKHPA